MRVKKILPHFFIAIVAITAMGCKRSPALATKEQRTEQTAEAGISQITTNIFGALINETDGVQFTPAQKVVLVKDSLKCKYARMNIALSTFSGTANLYDAYANAGIKVVLNISNKPTGSQQPFPTDTVAFKTKLSSVLAVYQPEVLVIENEEVNQNYHSGPLSDYFNELKAAINVAHSQSTPIKVTNGGIVCRMATLITWKSYIDSGLVNKAKNYAAKAFPADKLDANGNPDLTKGGYQAMLDTGLVLINKYKQLPLDYVNFHWYEPVAMRAMPSEQGGLDTISHIDATTLGSTIRCLRNKTGKEVITNEIGQLNLQPGITTDIMSKVKAMSVPYVLWYSGGDGIIGDAIPLQNGNGTLRNTGKAFRNFIITNYP
ncbi:hypothetical protein FW774_05425 (plasmid) [Pedobacter sp. BS3]|uniref:hypothetical protein n=1 Tax=Pedobacter sp. BS3 TaxID=2567937 RepID=UPI0011ED11A8|nr:hypothetical protein [Pedobacter sp. BS3]TZF86483.1 hypothetical protein FW774_05425 [Pedobacter sp. BS3]